MISNRTLVKVAVYGLVACIGGVVYVRHELQSRVRNGEYFVQALQHLNSSAGAVKLLGSPIKDTAFDLGDESKNSCDGQTAKFEVSVKGPIDRGTMFFWSSRKEEGWNLDRMELEVRSQKDKRFIIKKSLSE
ncbi:hypothetical protein ACFFRR_001484 [Megaselia abdita]